MGVMRTTLGVAALTLAAYWTRGGAIVRQDGHEAVRQTGRSDRRRSPGGVIPRTGLTETLTCGCTVPGRVYARRGF